MLMTLLERIPSYLRGSVDIFVTSEDILMYISLYVVVPSLGMCVTPLRDVQIVSRP